MSPRAVTSIVFLGFTVTCLVGCSSKTPPNQPVVAPDVVWTPEPASTTEPDASPAVGSSLPIGSFKGRNHTLTVYTGPDGPRFSVSTHDGKVLGDQMSADQLRAQLPEIYETFKSSIAGLSSHLDASIGEALHP